MRMVKTEEQWVRDRGKFGKDISGKWGIKSVVGEGRKEGRRGRTHTRGEKNEQTKYLTHGNDRSFDAVWKRCKLVCDRQVTMVLLNGTLKNTNEGMESLIERTHNTTYSMMCSGWKPFKDAHHF